MATVTDVEVANASFPNVRQDLNDILEALATNFSADAEPTTMYANQFWYETDTNLLKFRNEDNDAWITLAYFDQTADEWEVRTAVVQAVDGAGLALKTDEGTTRFSISDAGVVSFENYAFPSADGTAGQVLSTDGAGTLTFEDAGAGDKIEEGNSSVEVVDTGTGHVAITTDGSERMRIDSSGNVGIGTSSPDVLLDVGDSDHGSAGNTGKQIQSSQDFSTVYSGSNAATWPGVQIVNHDDTANRTAAGITFVHRSSSSGIAGIQSTSDAGDRADIRFATRSASGVAERVIIDYDGNLLVGTTATGDNDTGMNLQANGTIKCAREGNIAGIFNRKTDDGVVIRILQDGSIEGTISVSGSTVSYNGGHLARWSRLADDSKDTSIVKGTVMTNLDAMVEWSHDAVEAQDAVYETVTIPAEYDEDGNEITPETTEEHLISEAVEAKEAYTEENEQLNKMAVSSVEGDPNVAGVFVNWDNDDDFNDMNIAMTGDMVIRIAQGTTVQRGDLLMSAGDGTAKPQGDDIVRSKTIAKVTSTHVSHTYDDGSYLVPCVLMAC